ENFNTHKASSYVGINVGWDIGAATNVNHISSMSVDLYSGNDLLATNTGMMNKIRTVKGSKFSTPFIIAEGTYTANKSCYNNNRCIWQNIYSRKCKLTSKCTKSSDMGRVVPSNL
ncbi:MAG: hypothetical protein K0Q99_1572, partial [Clostridia bacterium]|nr:hypothetical protein [Clostridia bacterium]